ncbi:MAG: tetratricopeptide repeat protein [Bacteroidales bacterium]|nr:tetratricopeptide repeat protein [Bacteroidales bacterium]
MKYLGIILIIALVAVAGTHCTPKDPKAKIRSMEEKLSSENFTFDQKGIQLIEELITAYTDYAAENKNSEEAPEYLYKAAELSLNLNKPVQALELYNQIIYQYPDYHKTPECLFLLAFIYENHMLNLGKAKELYETFIERYPDHDFADDAAISIQNMGKSPEELIREFEEKAKTAES